jgi:hypothetical protein
MALTMVIGSIVHERVLRWTPEPYADRTPEQVVDLPLTDIKGTVALSHHQDRSPQG